MPIENLPQKITSEPIFVEKDGQGSMKKKGQPWQKQLKKNVEPHWKEVSAKTRCTIIYKTSGPGPKKTKSYGYFLASTLPMHWKLAVE